MKRILIILIISSVCGIIQARKSPHGLNFKIDCAVCHTTDNWKNVKQNGFDHRKTKFPLTGHHQQVNCRACHVDLSFKIKDFDCASCHRDIHENTLGDDCARCHNTSAWIIPDVRSIHRKAGFPLMGMHVSIDCNRCHKGGSGQRYETLSNDCFSCHKDDYYNSQYPNHAAANYSKDCNQCHAQNALFWSGTFKHDFFPLKGGHQLDCDACHKDLETYKDLTTSDCYSCHKDAYDNTTNPPHAASGFSTDCNTCHTIVSWKPANYDHDKLNFPINSGAHMGQWSSCNDCHTDNSNFGVFSCTNCHEHNQTKTDSQHREVRDYIYNSQNCYSCHPKGKSED